MLQDTDDVRVKSDSTPFSELEVSSPNNDSTMSPPDALLIDDHQTLPLETDNVRVNIDLPPLSEPEVPRSNDDSENVLRTDEDSVSVNESNAVRVNDDSNLPSDMTMGTPRLNPLPRANMDSTLRASLLNAISPRVRSDDSTTPCNPETDRNSSESTLPSSVNQRVSDDLITTDNSTDASSTTSSSKNELRQTPLIRRLRSSISRGVS